MADGNAGGNAGAREDNSWFGVTGRMVFQVAMMTMIMNIATNKNKQVPSNRTMDGGNDTLASMANAKMRNVWGTHERCDLFVHLSSTRRHSISHLVDPSKAAEDNLELLWHEKVWYEKELKVPLFSNISIGPLPENVLNGSEVVYVIATMLRSSTLANMAETPIAAEEVVTSSLALVVNLRPLDANEKASNLFDDSGPAEKKSMQSVLATPREPYFKTIIQIRPVFDHTVHTLSSLANGPFKKLKGYPDKGIYQPSLYVSDFWLLEKDYLKLNETLAEQRLNLTLEYNPVTLWAWSMQAQMQEQWMVQGEWGMTDTQRDSFMLKRLLIDTNPYLLAFSGLFILCHTLFSMLAFKNDIQFWRKNESMQGLSARSMIVSFVCQLITALYLLDSQETSRLIVFEICLDTALATWKLSKAVKVSMTPTFPFISFGGQKGYNESETAKHDDLAVRYMSAILFPMFIGYSVRSAVYGKHRGWWSFVIGSAAGGVYTFGFIMMTPQLYINYKLQSVEHLPWRALTYKAMNTFVDDIAALLIDMPMMHRLSCFRDDVIFFIYLYQRWKYRVDKSRPSIYYNPNEEGETSDQQEPKCLQEAATESSTEPPSAEPTATASAGAEDADCAATDAGNAPADAAADDAELRQRKRDGES
eukprot:gnl/TRDRNA2_/TRDRNA2_128581_c0_seq1.p1 gnl/TRDRNA2_/TRDRNA2_128581_c0~~gnl/TRDRNA2_/TRDRNA2_128581_c0_seq1.p1  ORF type:complete len:663 (+),score=127.18 gnl/TRDRNA2_/TRDRNA2_128581_c0_seq1:53-1990(+)